MTVKAKPAMPIQGVSIVDHEPNLIGDNMRHPVFESVVITVGGDETLWKITLGCGSQITISSDAVLNQRIFIKLCFAQIAFAFKRMPEGTWVDFINEAAARAVVERADEATSELYQFRELLRQYLTNRARGERQEDLLSNRPWEDAEAGVHWFRLGALVEFLKRENQDKYRKLSSSKIASLIREVGGQQRNLKILGKTERLYWVPVSSIGEATPDVEPPPLPREAV